MAFVHLLAQESGAHNLWNPTIIGVLTVLSAVGLFCGSVYLLLGTNLGGRLGFLVAAAGLTGFLVLLTTLWLTTPGSATGNSDLDPPHGDTASWKVVDVVNTPTDAKTASVRELPTKGVPITKSDDPLFTQVKPAMDAALVPPTPVAGQTPPAQPLAGKLGLSQSTDYFPGFPGSTSYYYKDKTQNFFFHRTRYAAIQVCHVKKDPATGTAVVPPVCDPLQDTAYVILKYNYGSIRVPVLMYWIFSILLFSLSLLGLYWWEKDERARKRAALAPVPVPTA